MKTVKVPEQFDPIFQQAEAFVRQYFSDRQEDPSRGVIEISGERYLLVRAASLSVDFFKTLADLYREKGMPEGEASAWQLLFDLAHAMGKQDATAFHAKMQATDPVAKLSVGPPHFAHTGWAFVEILPESNPSAGDDFYLIYDHPNSFEADSWLRAGKHSDEPVCVMSAGYSSGWTEKSYGTPLVATEILCRARGDETCRFIMAPPHRMEERVADYLKRHPAQVVPKVRYVTPGFFKRTLLEEAIRQASEAMVVADADLRFSFVNPAFTRLFGYSPEDVRGQPLAILSPPESSSSPSTDTAARIAATQGLFRGETLRRAKDGRLVPVLVNVSPLRENGGEIIGYVGSMTDLCEVKQAEDALRESEEKFRSASAAAQDALIILDGEGRISFWNAAAEKIFGYRAEEILGQPLHPLLAPKRYREAYEAGFAKFQTTGQGNAIGKTLELAALRKGGEEFPIEISLSSVKHGDQWLGIGIVRDITERKQIEAKLSLFRSLLDNSNDAVEVVDPATLRFLDVNDMECRDLGYTREELLSMRVSDIDPSFDSAANIAVQEQMKKTGTMLYEGVHRRKDGSTFPVEVSMKLVQLDRPYVLAIVRDITDRKHTEEEAKISFDNLNRINRELKELNDKLVQAQSQLMQSEKLASIGQLAAGVAHEINNPVGYVYSNMGTLEKYLKDFFAVLDAYEQAEPSLDEASRENIHRVMERVDYAFLKQDLQAMLGESREGLNRVKKIVQDLKDFSHVDEGVEWKLEDIHKGLESTLNVVWNELKYKCEVKKEYGELPLVECVLPQLNQVFMNLLVNAAQAIEGHGTVTLRTGTEGDRVWVEVADTGKGIPSENLVRIFDPFFTTKPVGKGTGLGLSVSYSIVQKHHGEITVESTVGAGTAFRVWLPVKQPLA